MLKKEAEIIKELFPGNNALTKRSIQYNLEGEKRCKIVIREVMKYLKKDMRNLSVLDIASGLGHMSMFLAPRTKRVYALDFNRKFTRITSKRSSLRKYKNLDIILGDATQIPFRESCFDLIIANDLYEHVTDQETLVREMFRTVKKGGYVIITTGNRFFPFELHTLLWFVTYMPRGLANKYVRFRKRKREFDIYQPTYRGIKKQIKPFSENFWIITEHLIEKSKKLHGGKYAKLFPILKPIIKSRFFKFFSPNFLIIAKK